MIVRMPYHVTVPGVTRTLFNTHCILLFILLTPPLRGITVRLVAAISTGKHGAGIQHWACAHMPPKEGIQPLCHHRQRMLEGGNCNLVLTRAGRIWLTAWTSGSGWGICPNPNTTCHTLADVGLPRKSIRSAFYNCAPFCTVMNLHFAIAHPFVLSWICILQLRTLLYSHESAFYNCALFCTLMNLHFAIVHPFVLSLIYILQLRTLLYSH